MLIPDHWYVACPSSRLGASEPRAVQIGDLPLVVFRAEDGAPCALLDRCCHRGVRLSLGRVRQGCIACGYHGWEFDGSGELIRVPSLPAGESRPSGSVPAYPTIERDHYVWVWIAGRHAEPTYEPALQGLEDGLWVQQTAIWKTAVMPAVENQLDVAHTPHSHPGLYPGHETAAGVAPPMRPLTFECRADDDSVIVFAPPRGAEEPSPPLGDGVGLFELPYRNYVFLEADSTKAIYNWVPLSEGSCRLEFMGTSKSGQAAVGQVDGVHVLYLEDELPLLAQDRRLLESAEETRALARPERSVVADVVPLMARQLVARALGAEADPSSSAKSKRRVFTCVC